MKFKFLTIFIFLLIHSLSFAQTVNISGTVKDARDGETLPGVSVRIPGTSRGDATDINGEFKISASVGDSLVFTYMGKKPQVVIVGSRTILDVLMYDDETQLDEVVVAAFIKQKKSSITSSITAVNTKDLRIPASNLTTALAGAVPGLISFQTTGEPGADNASFFVRGVSSFGYAKEPLILIDGVEATKDEFARLQVDDVESFAVLKDAAAAVMYGARSANGIITVTTKSGREGNNKVSFRYDANYSSPTQRIEFLDGVTYMNLYNEAQLTRNPSLGAYYNAQKIMMTERGEYPMIFPNVDWYGDMFNQGTWNQKGRVDISGGGQVANYFVGATIENETGLLKVDKRNNFNNNINIVRTMLRSNVTFKFTKSTTLETRIQARFERYTGPNATASSLFSTIMNSNPVDFPPVYEPDLANADKENILFGSTILSGSGIKANPYAQMVSGYEDRNTNYITAQALLRQDFSFILPGLEASIRASGDTYSMYSSRRSYNPYYYALQSFNQATGDYVLFPLNESTGSIYLGNVSPNRDASAKFYFEGIVRWAGNFDVHNVSAQLVGTATENLYGGGSLSIYETLPEKNLVLAGRANYNYDTRYFVEFTFGYNGSEKFTGDKIYGFFPAFSAAWLISNETFFDNLKSTIPVLKLKGSWGLAGNDAIGGRGDRFKYLSEITKNTDPYGLGYRFGSNFMNSSGGYSINRYANPDITWEKTAKSNLGIELSLFKNESIRLEAEYFTESLSQIYWPRENFPATAGLAAALSGNVGKVDTKGFDAQLNINHQFNRDFWVSGRVNFTYSRNKIVDIDERLYPDIYLRRKGYPVNQVWGLVAERLFIDQEEIKNSPRQDFGEYMAGDIKYKDVNGDGVVNSNDRVAIGYPSVPEMQYGFGPSIGYKNFDISFFMQGNGHVSKFIDANSIAPFVNFRNALPLVAKDYWSETAPNPHAFWPRLSVNTLNNNTQTSSWWMRNGSFLRMKQIEAGYSVKSLQKLYVENMRIYFMIENLFVLSKFKLWDPEMSSGLAYPLNRRFNIGIKFDF